MCSFLARSAAHVGFPGAVWSRSRACGSGGSLPARNPRGSPQNPDPCVLSLPGSRSGIPGGRSSQQGGGTGPGAGCRPARKCEGCSCHRALLKNLPGPSRGKIAGEKKEQLLHNCASTTFRLKANKKQTENVQRRTAKPSATWNFSCSH